MMYRVYHTHSFQYLGLVDAQMKVQGDNLALSYLLNGTLKNLNNELKFIPFPRTKGSISKTLDEMRLRSHQKPAEATSPESNT